MWPCLVAADALEPTADGLHLHYCNVDVSITTKGEDACGF